MMTQGRVGWNGTKMCEPTLIAFICFAENALEPAVKDQAPSCSILEAETHSLFSNCAISANHQ